MAILVVDDSRAMRMIVKRELRKAGYEDVVEADNGSNALQTIRCRQSRHHPCSEELNLQDHPNLYFR